LRINEPLSSHTSFKVGGPAQFWVEPEGLSDLQNLVNLAYKKKIPLRVIGAGSNILADDKGIKGIVLKLNSPYFKRITVRHQIVSAYAGARLVCLVRLVLENGLSGFELLGGIPGTVGGALIMNAGNIGDNVLNVSVMDRQGKVKILRREDIRFGYRDSSLTRYIILSAQFKLIKRDKRTIKKRIGEYLEYRKRTQDLSWPSAGCVFKNPNLNSAGYFIERCGLKGCSVGDAAVSFKHANFIINRGKARSADILKLMRCITRCVRKRFNLDLEPEIKIWKN